MRGFGPGERVVFLPYTEEMYERAQRWIEDRLGRRMAMTTRGR